MIEGMNTLKIAVFGSAFASKDSDEWRKAYRFGRECARRGYKVVCGGYGGIMEAVSKGASEEGGDVVGILCTELRRTPNPYLTERFWVHTYPERLAALMNSASVYVFFDGGVGTLTEFLLVWSMRCREIRKENKWFVVGSNFKNKVLKVKELLNEEMDVVFVEEPEGVFEYIE